MDYNTELLNSVAQQLAKMFKVLLLEHAKTSDGRKTIAQIEAAMRETLRQIGLQALSILLSSLQLTPESEIGCECGGTLQYQRLRPATVISVFGKMSYERAYYADCACHKGKAPLDQQLGLQPGAVTAGLAQLLALAGIEFSYEESQQWLQAFLLFDVSENTIRSETQQMGELQEGFEAQWIQNSQNEGWLQQRQREPAKGPVRLYGSIDAAKVRIEPRPKKGRAKEVHEDWRDMKVLCWFEVENVPASQQSARQRQKVEREQLALRAKQMQYFCDITEAEEFGKLVWATGCQLQADLAQELIFLGDGAVWIWKLVERYYSGAIQIVDWFHAEEHLEGVAAAIFPDVVKRKAWLEPVSQALWEGRVEDVIRECQRYSATHEAAQKAVGYFTTHMERMRYDRFRAAGYMIGSGTIESACKQIVSQRLKLPGAQWEVEGAVQTAKARAAWLSGHWQSLCSQRSALPLAI